MQRSAPHSDSVADHECIGCARADRLYAKVDGNEMFARVYRPITRAVPDVARPVVIHAIGGGWTDGSRELDPQLHRALVADGVVSVVPDLRSGPGMRHPAAQSDFERAVRWVLDHADALGIDPSRVVLVGSASGAHTALAVAATSASLRRRRVPAGVVLRHPVLDPLTALHRLDAVGEMSIDDRMEVEATREYFGTLQQMRRAGLPEMVFDGAATNLPPVWTTRTSGDRCAAAHAVDELAFAWARSGGRIRVFDCDGLGPPEIDRSLLNAVLELTRREEPSR